MILVFCGVCSIIMGLGGYTRKNQSLVITDRYGGTTTLPLPDAEASGDDRTEQAVFGVLCLVGGLAILGWKYGKPKV